MKLKIIFFVLFKTYSIIALGQADWITRNLTGQELTFLTHKDSISNLYKINNGIVIIGNDTINLINSVTLYFEFSEFYQDKIKTYLLYNENNYKKGLYTTLDFYKDRLIEINMFTTNPYYLSNFKIEINRHFKKNQNRYGTLTNDSIVRYENMIVTYGQKYSDLNYYGTNKNLEFEYYEDLIKGNGHFFLADKKVSKLIPMWCATCNQRKTWEKLNKYIDKKSNKYLF